jgi:hypothetical protein
LLHTMRDAGRVDALRRLKMRVLRVARICVVVLLIAGGDRWAVSQLVPLLPPLVGDSGEEATPQQSRSAQMVQEDLAAGRFDALDQMADRLLRTKARNVGGGWKLDTFYAALEPREPADAATEAHMAQLERWIAASKNSQTARVAMAKSLIRWAWVARGNGLEDTVTPEMDELFSDRIERSRKVLEDAAKVGTMCPEWYAAMMTVGLAQGWSRATMQELYNRATHFEPGYLEFYRAYANYLLPKWEGKPGDAPAVAKTAADRAGGDEGDLIYFEFATIVIKRGNGGIPTKQMDWERIKRGGDVLEKQYGESRTTINQFAFMAWRYRDAAAAGPAFAAIGDKWAPAVWKQKANFDKAREWAEGHAESPAAPPVN